MPGFLGLDPAVKPNFGTPLDRSHPTADGLWLELLCNEDTGPRLYDTAGGLALTGVGSPTRAPAGMLSAINLDGSTQYYQSVNPVTTSFGNNYSLESWFILNIVDTVRRTIFSVSNVANIPQLECNFGNAAGGIGVIFPGIFVAGTAAGVVVAGALTHVIGLRRGTGANSEVWVNGVKQSLTNNLTNANSDASGTLLIGARTTATQFFPGKIAVVRAWNRDLAPEEVTGLYARPFQMSLAPPTRRFYLPAPTVPPHLLSMLGVGS